MNIDDAIKAHAQWKTKLALYLSNPDGSLKPADIAPDNRCDLGKWIYGEGRTHAHLPELETLRTTHAAFHNAAASVVRKIDSGEQRDLNVLTGFSSEFGALSLRIVNLLKTLAGKIG